MFGIVQVILVIVLIAVIIFYFGKIRHVKKSLIAGLIFCMVISAVISNAVLSIIPMPTEKVIVTATGEKNENASSNEIFIANLIIGGEEYELPTPSEGEWYWWRGWYVWRNESDARRPQSLTRSITLDIPYGCDRSILFAKSQWMGIVEVSYGDETKSYDLFLSGSDDETAPYAPIPDTKPFALYGAKLLRLGLFVLLIVLLMAYPVYASMKFDYETIKKFWKKHWDKSAYIAIAISCFVFMFNLGKQGSLWFDEVWTVGIYLTDNFNYSIIDFFQNLWVKCMPYGQEYLLTLPEILVAFSIYTMGLIGNKLKGKHLGVILAALCSVSSGIITQCGTEFRGYSFILLFSVLTVYMFIKKQNELGSEKTLTLILYGLCLALFMYSHIFGLVTAGIIMIFDFVLIIIRKSKVKGLLEFVLPAVYGFYWLFKYLFPSVQAYGGTSWPSKPTIKSVVNLIIMLCGNDNWQFVLFVLGLVFIICCSLSKVKQSEFDFKNDYTLLVLISTPILVIVVNIIASTVVASSSLFVSRYFIPIIVFFLVIIGIAIDMIIEVVTKRDISSKNEGVVPLTIAFAFAISQCTINWLNQSDYTPDNYKEAAEYLMTQNDIYSDSTIVIVYGASFVNDGFEYYLTHNGKRQSINHQPNETDFTEFDIVYVVYQHFSRSIVDDSYFADLGYVNAGENASLKTVKFVKTS